MPSKKSIRKQQRKAYLDSLPTTTMQQLIDDGEIPEDIMFMSHQEISDWQMAEIKAGRQVSNKYDYETRDHKSDP